MIRLSDGRTFDNDADYFRHLDSVAHLASCRVQAASEQRRIDELRFPLLNIQNWSWRTYEKWRERDT